MSIYLKGFSDEMVHRIIPLILRTFILNMLQKSVHVVYARLPQTQAALHWVHPAMALVREEWLRAAKLERPANLRNLSTQYECPEQGMCEHCSQLSKVASGPILD
jgi:hypothetical protein